MKKFLKWTGIILGIMALVFVLTILTIVTCVSPSHFKPMLIAQLMNYTGRQFMIEGQLSWTFYPHFGIKADHVIVNNPPSFQPTIFAEIEHVTLGIKLLPLLHKKIESNGIALDGMRLNLLKDREGRVNWGSSMSTPSKPHDYEADVVKHVPLTLPNVPFAIAISSFDITHSEINFNDEQTKNSFSIDHLEFHAKDLSLLNPFTIATQFDFANNKQKLSGHVDFSSQFSANWLNQQFSLNEIDLKATIKKKHKTYPITLTGDLQGDLKEDTLIGNPLQGSIGEMSLSGQLNVTQLFTDPKVVLHLQAQPFDLRAWMKATGEDISDIQAFNGVTGNLQITSAQDALHVEGRILADQIEIHKIKLSQVQIPLHFDHGILELSPLTGKAYQGQLLTHIKWTLGIAPHLSIQGKLDNINVGQFLEDLGDHHAKIKLGGKGSLDLMIATTGLRKDTVLKNLNGSGHLQIAAGVLQGIDIGYYLDSARHFLKGQPAEKKNSGQTEFKSLTGTLQIQNGVIQNNDLVLSTEWFTTSGRGHVNIVTQQLNYQLQTKMNTTGKKIDDWKNLYGITIPIALFGSLNNPSIRLDTSDFVKVAASEEFKNTRKKWEKKIKSFLGQ